MRGELSKKSTDSEKKRRETSKRILPETCTREIKTDTLTYDDDVTNETSGIHKLYPNITTIEKVDIITT